MLSVSASNQIFVVAGAVCSHLMPEFPDMKRGWTASFVFGAGSCLAELANSNGKVIRTATWELTPSVATSFLFESEQWLVSGTDGSPSLIPSPGVFDPLSLRLDAGIEPPAPAVLSEEAEKAEAVRLDIYTKGVWDKDTGTVWWEYAVKAPDTGFLARAQGTTATTDCGSIGGELAACMRAVQWALKNNQRAITLHCEYPGSQYWANGRWHANKPTTAAYAAFMQKVSPHLSVWFRQIPSAPSPAVNQQASAAH